jgi:UbiD family decarboxylase
MGIEIDYSSIPRSYRDYLDLMVREGEYLAIDDEVDWNLEMGAIQRRASETLSPSPIFNKIKDCPGFRATVADGGAVFEVHVEFQVSSTYCPLYIKQESFSEKMNL